MRNFFPNAPQIVSRYPIFFFSLLLLLLGLFQFFFGNKNFAGLVFTLIVVIGGIPLIYETAREVMHGNWGADIIAVLAIVTSLLLGENLAGSIIIIMLSGGRALEDFALKSASDALAQLAEKAPRIAHLVKPEDSISDVKVEEVREKDVLLVKPGELIPVDSVIIEGETSLNESALTGEPVPTHRSYNSAVLSGSVNLDNPIKIRCLRPASESKYEQIVALVKSAQATKAPIHRLADRYGAYFTPLTVGIALLTYLLTYNVTHVLAVLVVATPCPLILATPIAVMGGINKSAKKGIIVKNGGSLEKAGEAKAVVFDKTGTLTFGEPKVLEVNTFGKVTEQELLFYASSVERLSAHILAKAVTKKAFEAKIDPVFPDNYNEKFGKGVAGEVNKKQITIGNLTFLQGNNIEIKKELLNFKEKQNEVGRMVSFVAFEKEVVGAIVFGDEIRPDIKKIISNLRESGIASISMLTGDNQTVAAQVAKETGIDEVKAQTLPDEKVEYVQKVKEKYENVVMVGDGFNDAPALATATVGVALGAGGSSVSSESADIVLVVDNLDKIRELLSIGKNVLNVAKQGIFFGMGASFVAMIFAAFGYIPPVEGAILQEVIDVVVIFNALRTSS